MILDDSVLDKNFSKKIENACRQWSGNARKVITGVGGDMVKSCVWRSGGFLSCADFVVVPDSVLEGASSRDVG